MCRQWEKFILIGLEPECYERLLVNFQGWNVHDTPIQAPLTGI